MSRLPAKAPGRVILVPGFTSPRWVLFPLYRYLRNRHEHVDLWDHPRVFSELDVTVNALAGKLRTESQAGRRIGLVSHSFGDWVARSALAEAGDVRISKLISITPVATRVPLARWIHWFSGRLIPEIRIMADEEKAGEHLVVSPAIEHIIFWARWDLIVRRPRPWPNPKTRHRLLRGTHVSLAFQPNLWRAVAEELK